ncbi:hypothetical protein BJ741DRAFT_611495 [Chytriomyces cf. hyalinus JEL632]|nr:hypothetical protein BJ741DRAFT_611495 [Chytriomyces cf. hyalinus JEL632]
MDCEPQSNALFCCPSTRPNIRWAHVWCQDQKKTRLPGFWSEFRRTHHIRQHHIRQRQRCSQPRGSWRRWQSRRPSCWSPMLGSRTWTGTWTGMSMRMRRMGRRMRRRRRTGEGEIQWMLTIRMRWIGKRRRWTGRKRICNGWQFRGGGKGSRICRSITDDEEQITQLVSMICGIQSSRGVSFESAYQRRVFQICLSRLNEFEHSEFFLYSHLFTLFLSLQDSRFKLRRQGQILLELRDYDGFVRTEGIYGNRGILR